MLIKLDRGLQSGMRVSPAGIGSGSSRPGEMTAFTGDREDGTGYRVWVSLHKESEQ